MKANFLLIIFFFLLSTSLKAQHIDYPKMIFVKGGTFKMGDQHFVGTRDEFPLHEVSLQDFWIGETEVTVAQWRTFCKDTNRDMPPEPTWKWHEDHPVVNILWNEAVDYCTWLSEKTNRTYRLPTEAEWEYAARGGNKSKGYKYSGGQWLDKVGWFATNSNRMTQPVAQKKPNELGIFDMTGNVWEWCSDWEGRSFTREKQINPLGPNEGRNKVIKGGAYAYASNINRISFRISLPPDIRRLQTGLRVVYH